jgi:tight adherence protein C
MDTRHATLNFVLDTAQILSVIGFFASGAMLSLGAWNFYIARFVSEAEASGGRESFLKSLRTVFLSRVRGFNEKRFSKQYLARLTNTLMVAGDPSELKAGEFVGLQEVSLGVFALFALLLVFGVELRWFWVAPLLLVGWYLPRIWLYDMVTKRHHSITRALPYNLDLLTLSVEAGLDFAQAVGKVVEKGRQGPLADELRIVLKTIKLGKTREDALRTMSERVQLPSLSSFVNALIQADRMGTSLGKILRIQSTQLRIERTNRAEKLANEAPVKLLFPLIFFIFPTVFMVLFGPIVYEVLNTSL